MKQFGDFEEKGYRFVALIPESSTEGHAFRVEILKQKQRLHIFAVPMDWEPRFGVDAGDLRLLEDITDKILEILPEPDDFSQETIKRIDEIVRDMS